MTGRGAVEGTKVYRLITPQVIWWAWAAAAVVSLGDLAIQGRDLGSVRFALGVLTVTGLVFACTLWPRMVASNEGITVLNPFRTFDIPWGAVRGIFIADSIEVKCARAGENKKDKTVYSWAIGAPRRSRAKAQLRGRQWDRGRRSGSRPAGYERLSDQAKELAKMHPAELIARELAQRSEALEQSADGAYAAVMSARWAWPPVLATLIPAAGFAIALLV